MKQIGIFAGTFDPIHNGHLAFAQKALEQGLEKVMFLPEPRPRRKQGVHALEHRIAMVQLAVAREAAFGVIQLEQPKFTPLETLPALQARFKGYELALLFGDDVINHMVDHIADWPHIKNLAESAHLIIATRHENQAELQQKIESLKADYGLPFMYTFVEPGHTQTSSSTIRQAAKKQQILRGLPDAVGAYIVAHNLYAAGEIIS